MRKAAGVTRDGVTAHSAHHTWQDRLDAARVPIAERDYLITHKTKQSSAEISNLIICSLEFGHPRFITGLTSKFPISRIESNI